MLKLLQLHMGLLKYLKIELPKKKFLEGVKFVISIVPVYLKELLKLYKNIFLIFNKEYQKQKIQSKKMQNIKADLQRCLKILKYVDEKMDKAGVNRQRRRQFWRDFYRDGAMRKDVFDDLLKEIERIK
jgi:hypothetical protein